MRNSIIVARHGVNELRNQIIGVFKHPDNLYEMVIDWDSEKDKIDLINITCFGAIQETFGYPCILGEFKLFPDNKNINEMLDNPFEWDAFMKQFS
jgi:hypothetical protein